MSASRLTPLAIGAAIHGLSHSTMSHDDDSMPPPKRRKLASPVACCDPACLHLQPKPCYDKSCRDAIGYACPDICPETVCPDAACIDTVCPDVCKDPPCLDETCLEAACHDACDTNACLDPCIDPCAVGAACSDNCHSSHNDYCLPTCDLTACTDACIDYDCHAFDPLFDNNTCQYWTADPCFDLSSLSSTSSYPPTYTNTPSSHADDYILDSFGQSAYNSHVHTPYSAPSITSAPNLDLSFHPNLNASESPSYASTPVPGSLVCQWAGCTAGSFGSAEALHVHVKSAHSAKTPSGFVCRWAGCDTTKPDASHSAPYSAATKNHFHRHMQRHTGFAPHKCATCDRCFKTPQQLNNHLKTHTGERQFKCAYCPKTFALLDPLRIHERVHTAEKRFQCPICGDRGADSSNMSAHKRDIHGANGIPCPDPDCKHRDSRAERLKQHMRDSGHQVWRLTDGVAFTEYCRSHRGSARKRSANQPGRASAAPASRCGSLSCTPAPEGAVLGQSVDGIQSVDELMSGEAMRALFDATGALSSL